jgi:acyl-CoA thioesterase
MQYSEILDSVEPGDGAFTATVPEDWWQGRTLFGGIHVAIALRAMRTLVPAGVPLRVVQTTFVAPASSQRVAIRAGLLRSGKSAFHTEARTVDGGQVLAVVTAVFGIRRTSRIEVIPRQPPVVSERPIDFRHVPGRTPSFTQHLTMRWLVGDLPFTGNSSTRAVIEVGLNDVAKTSEEHVLAIADSIPPVALSMLDTPVPGSSLTWKLEMLCDKLDDLPLQGWRLDAEMTAGRDGYTHQSVMVWGPGGVPVALSRQCMVVFG